MQQCTDINQYEENAAMVENINKIEDGLVRAKMYKHREYLLGMEPTDYSQVTQCAKDFKPYWDLWLTVRSGIHLWRRSEYLLQRPITTGCTTLGRPSKATKSKK